MRFLGVLSIFCLILPVSGEPLFPLNKQFVNNIGIIESNNNDFAIGDGGNSISRYQIGVAAYIDAKQYDKSINFSYQSLTKPAHALKVMTAYMNRYERRAVINNDFEALARLWNSGPNWRKKKHLTNNYWLKYKKLNN